MFTINRLKSLLREVNDHLVANGIDKDARWTRAIKEHLIEFGHQNEQWVFASRARGADGGEWIYDVCFIELEDAKPSPYFTSMTLAVESEWSLSQNAIIEDFQKLLCCKSAKKLFIYQGSANLLSYFKKNIGIWDDPKDTYLIARYDSDEQAFKFTEI